MAKLIIIAVAAFCMVACATAAAPSGFPMLQLNKQLNKFTNYGFEVQAATCPSSVCASTQASCYSSDYSIEYTCIPGEFNNQSSSYCNCRRDNQFLSIGATCLGAMTSECGAHATCSSKTVRLRTDTVAPALMCVGTKKIGDSCVTSNDCSGLRVCNIATSTCAATLMVGAVCSNFTLSAQPLGICPLTAPCNPTAADPLISVCQTYLASGATCSLPQLGLCRPPAMCGGNAVLGSTTFTCDILAVNTIATGAKVGLFGSLSCVSGVANTTSGLCVDYSVELAKWQAAFPTPASTACTVSASCNLVGVALATCECTQNQVNNVFRCQLQTAPALLKPALALYLGAAALVTRGIVDGCESVTLDDLPYAIMAGGHCINNYKAVVEAAFCPIRNLGVFSCYGIGLCSGAAALQSSVFVTMIVAAIAFFTQQ